MSMNLQQMTREEKLKAMHAIWEDLARDEGAMASPGWHGILLQETTERLAANHEIIHDWSDAKAELRKRSQ